MGYVMSKYSHCALKQTLTVGKFSHRELCRGGWKQAISSIYVQSTVDTAFIQCRKKKGVGGIFASLQYMHLKGQ